MRKELLTSVCALSLVFGATAAFAGGPGEPATEEGPVAAPAPATATEETETVDYAAMRPYIGAGGLWAFELFDGVGPGPEKGGGPDDSGGFYASLGFRVWKYIALEARYENYREFDLDPGRINGWSVSGNVKGFFMTGDIQPYLVLGGGWLDMSRSSGNPPTAPKTGNGGMLRVGGGADFCLTEHIALGPELTYVLPFGDAEDLDFVELSAGVRITF